MEHEVKKLKLDKLKTHPLNPNVMDSPQFKALKKNISKYGYNEYIVVADCDGEYWVMDGAHRLLALQELGYDSAEVIVVSGISKQAYWMAPLSYNRTRGKVDNKKVAEFLLNATNEFGKDQVMYWSGLDKEKYNAYVGIMTDVGEAYSQQQKKFVPVDEVATDIVNSEEKHLKNVKDTNDNKVVVPLTFYFNTEDKEYVLEMLKKWHQNKEKALIKVIETVEGK